MTAPLTLEKLAASDRLASIAESLRNGDEPIAVTVRDFLSWFGAYRRGYIVVQRIRKALGDAGIVTKPDFESAYIDSQIGFALSDGAAGSGTAAEQTPAAEPVLVLPSDASPVSIGIADPTYRIGKLQAANNAPVRVAPDGSVDRAVTLMLGHDFSQLPVMTNDYTVKGAVTWRSLATRWAFDRNGTMAKDFLDEAPEVPSDRSLFSAIPIIAQHGFVLVRDASNKISGIVTTSDLSVQFQQLAEPFLLLGEIENHVRRLIDGRFTKEELVAAKDPSDTARKVEGVTDLNYGEYIRLLENPIHWAKLQIPIERKLFIEDLQAVRDIRNDVMHFDPDPVGGPELETLRRFAKFLQTLQSLGA